MIQSQGRTKILDYYYNIKKHRFFQREFDFATRFKPLSHTKGKGPLVIDRTGLLLISSTSAEVQHAAEPYP
jgi:hypothetical protein